jgi:hypothetical protein
VSATASAALVRVVATPLPLLMGGSSSVSNCGRGAREAECSAKTVSCMQMPAGIRTCRSSLP